ncbi:MAG TPA: hypothetical protein VFI65_11280 [Streptosporangiaceae bacterium]|nr:hypothetical protein [Streptosporangiaceae bacterium]
MRAAIADAVRKGGQLTGQRPSALAAFLAAAAFAPFLVPGPGGEATLLLNQLGSLGSGYLAAVLTSAAERDEPDDLAEEIQAGLEAEGEQGAGLRAEVSAVLREIGAVQAAVAANPQIASGLAELSEQVSEFAWMLGDTADRLSELVGQGARHGRDLRAARTELGALTALLQRVVQVQDHALEREPARPTQCPYPGLRPFESRDAARFFGREDLTAHLIARLTEQVSVNAPLLVFGSSGAGKSSLLRAGLIPALRRGRLLPVAGSAKWPRILLDRLGADPLAALAAAMGGGAVGDDDDPAVVAAGLGPASRFVLVVDQFEEIFTHCADARARQRFVRVLLALAARGLVVLGVRADFYADCASLADLGDLLAGNQVIVGPLAEDDLRRAITLPALQAGCTVEPGLPELMITDLGLRPGVADYEPGALPLLAYALRATWERRAGSRLTVAGYRDAGGIHGAVAAEAERICADLPAGGVDAARRILLRLVNVGPDGQLTRRRVPRTDVLAEIALATTVLDRFTQARLVTADSDGVEITHEAFLAAWPRLTAWIAEDRAGLRLHRQLGEDTRAWEKEGRDAGSLYRGARLSGAVSWRAANESELTSLERSFLDASAAAEEAIRHRDRRQNRRLRALSAGLAVALVAALAAGGVVVRQQRQAVHQRKLEQSAKFAAESDTDETSSLRTSDLEALAAWSGNHGEATRSSLLSREADPYLGSYPEPPQDRTTATAVSPDGKLMAVAEQPGANNAASAIQVWDVVNYHLLKTFPHLGGGVQTLAFSPDGRTLAATVYSAPDLRFWDLASYRRLPDPFAETDAVATAVSYSPAGHLIAIAASPLTMHHKYNPNSDPSRVDVWDTVGHKRLHRSNGLIGEITSLSFSPDGHLVAEGGYSDQSWLLDLRAKQEYELSTGLSLRPAAPSSALISPDGRHVAISADNQVVLKSLGTSDIPDRRYNVAFAATAATSPAIAFGPQGKYLYASTGQGAALGSYDVAARARISPDYEPPSFFSTLASSGSVLIGGSFDGVVSAFDLGQRTLTRLDGLNAVATTRDGRLVATGGFEDTIQLWRPDDPAQPKLLPTAEPQPTDGLAFSTDRRLLAATFRNCDVMIWHLGTTDPPVVLPGNLDRPGKNTVGDSVAFIPGTHNVITNCSYVSVGPPAVQVDSILVRGPVGGSPQYRVRLPKTAEETGFAISPDGSRLAVSTGTGTVMLLKTGTDHVIAQITGQGNGPLALAFSPDGTWLATANSTDDTGTVRLWNARTGTLVRHFGQGPPSVRNLVFSPGGHLLAAASQDATVRLWNPATGRLTISLAAFPSVQGGQVVPTIISQVAFLTGYRLVAADDSGNAAVWDLNPATEVDHLCTVLGQASVADWWSQQRPSPGPFPCTGKTSPGEGKPATAAIPAP